VLHLASLDFITAHENVIFLGPPGTGKTQPTNYPCHNDVLM